MNVSNKVGVYVPTSEIKVLPGSAIVGPLDPPTSTFRVWIEASTAGIGDLKNFTERVKRAAGRMSEGRPTLATRIVQHWQVVRVAVYDPATSDFIVEDEEKLHAWLKSAVRYHGD
jgi:hypothetical protein